MEEIEFILELVLLESLVESEFRRLYVLVFFFLFRRSKSSEWLCFEKDVLHNIYRYSIHIVKYTELLCSILTWVGLIRNGHFMMKFSSLTWNKCRNSRVHKLRGINLESTKTMIDFHIFFIHILKHYILKILTLIFQTPDEESLNCRPFFHEF